MNGGENHCQKRVGAALSPRPLEGSQLPLCPFSRVNMRRVFRQPAPTARYGSGTGIWGLAFTYNSNLPHPTPLQRATSEWHSLVFLLFQGQKIKSCGGSTPRFHEDKITHLTSIHLNIILLGPFTFIRQQVTLTVFNNYYIFIKQVMRSRNKS